MKTTSLKGRDFLAETDFTREEIETVIDVAFDLKRERAIACPAERKGGRPWRAGPISPTDQSRDQYFRLLKQVPFRAWSGLAQEFF